MKRLNEDQGTFHVRGDLLDLEEDMQVALGELDDVAVKMGPHAPKELHAALDALHAVARKLKNIAGLSDSVPPPLK